MTTPVQDQDTLRADLASLRIDRSTTRKRRPRRRRWPIIVALVALAAAAATWMFTSRAVPVTVAYATRTVAGQAGPAPVLSGSGYVVTGDRYVSVGVRVPGRIEKYYVEEGQNVHKGDALVQIDDRDYRAAVARAEAQMQLARANVGLAQSDLNRIRVLRRQQLISEQELDIQENKANVARATLAQAEAELTQANVNLDYTVLRAPTDGVILAKQKEVGEIAVPGGFAGSGDLIRLANLSDMRAQVDVNEADLNRVRIGQPAWVTPDAYPDAKYNAQVVKLYPQVDRQKGTLRVEVHISDPDDKLLPDMSARITFLSAPPVPEQAASSVVLAPINALRRDERGDTYVWVITDEHVRSVHVETSGKVGEHMRIASGLEGGETLVVGDPPLRDGQKVNVVQ